MGATAKNVQSSTRQNTVISANVFLKNICKKLAKHFLSCRKILTMGGWFVISEKEVKTCVSSLFQLSEGQLYVVQKKGKITFFSGKHH